MRGPHTSLSLKILFIVLFAGYYLGGTAFTHTHHYLTFSITHSHPYLPGDDGVPRHGHTLAGFFTIEQMNDFETESLSFFSWGQIWTLLFVFVFSFRPVEVVRPQRRSSLRAPPCTV